MAEARDIFIVCNNFEELGGLQTWAHHIGRLFAARGHRVHLVGITHAQTPHDHGSDFPYELSVLYDGHPPWAWRPKTILGRADVRARWRERQRRIERAEVLARLSRLFQSAAPGGVVIAAQVWAMEWVAEADTSGLQVIGMSHESYDATRTSSRYGRVKRFFADVDRLLVLTAEDADAWANDGMANADWMPNPLHVVAEEQARLVDPVVVRLGRLAYEKGQDMLLDAWPAVVSAHPDWRLRLYGSGPAEGDLRAQVTRLAINGSVQFAGSTSQVGKALLGASIFALTSREEGFPMSILEAMAYGVPCVAFDCAPGIRELITDGVDGFIVQPGHTVAFSEAVCRLIEDEELRLKMGQAAQESVQRFTPDVVVDRWERLLTFLDR